MNGRRYVSVKNYDYSMTTTILRKPEYNTATSIIADTTRDPLCTYSWRPIISILLAARSCIRSLGRSIHQAKGRWSHHFKSRCRRGSEHSEQCPFFLTTEVCSTVVDLNRPHQWSPSLGQRSSQSSNDRHHETEPYHNPPEDIHPIRQLSICVIESLSGNHLGTDWKRTNNHVPAAQPARQIPVGASRRWVLTGRGCECGGSHQRRGGQRTDQHVESTDQQVRTMDQQARTTDQRGKGESEFQQGHR